MKVRDLMQRHVTIVRQDDPLFLARQLMGWYGIRHLPVLPSSGHELVGVISERDLFRAYQANPARTDVLERPIREFMSYPAVSIGPDAELSEGAALLTTRKLGCLVVAENNRVVGMLSVTDVLAVLALSPVEQLAVSRRSPGVTVASIMYPRPIRVYAQDPLLNVASQMAASSVRHACVVDETGRVTGIVSDKDLRRTMGDPRVFLAYEAAATPLRVNGLSVAQAMTFNPRVVDKDDAIERALNLLIRERIGALPVVDSEHRLCGIVSYVDLLRHYGEQGVGGAVVS
jgi:CBS domain-containing protein